MSRLHGAIGGIVVAAGMACSGTHAVAPTSPGTGANVANPAAVELMGAITVAGDTVRLSWNGAPVTLLNVPVQQAAALDSAQVVVDGHWQLPAFFVVQLKVPSDTLNQQSQ